MLSFLVYYLKLRIAVWFGVHKTVNPVTFKWRWGQWRLGRLQDHRISLHRKRI